MSLFTKTKTWMIASLAAFTTSFANQDKCSSLKKSFDHGREMALNQMMPGYGAPARIDVRGSWDVYASGSFTYWQSIQDNMELGSVSTSGSPNTTNSVVNMAFNYTPGFKVGLGMNLDHDSWDTFLQYAWFRGQHGNATHLDPTNSNVVLIPNWGTPASTTYFDGKEHWRLHMDLLDWELARAYYVGTKLSFRPFIAARAAWIRQNMDVVYANTSDFTGVSNFSKNKAQSWAIGPRVGLYSNWLLGEGIRLFGNTMGDILFTQYTKLRTYNGLTNASGVATSATQTLQTDVNCLRGHLEGEFGFGWGSYFDNNNWHIDLSASYGFQVFFSQNMFRKFTDVNSRSSFSPNGDLYLHGLTVTARFDF
jgi:hypothetical protein